MSMNCWTDWVVAVFSNGPNLCLIYAEVPLTFSVVFCQWSILSLQLRFGSSPAWWLIHDRKLIVNRSIILKLLYVSVCKIWLPVRLSPQLLQFNILNTNIAIILDFIANGTCGLLITPSLPSSKCTFSQPFKEKCISEVERIGSINHPSFE